MLRTKCVVILDTMWGAPGNAPGMFRINPNNFTGRRLHYFLGHSDFWVTNSCRECVGHAKAHGTPDPGWLKQNLERIKFDLLLICGNVAKRTFHQCEFEVPESVRVLEIPHPAWRAWTKQKLEETKELIQNADCRCEKVEPGRQVPLLDQGAISDPSKA